LAKGSNVHIVRKGPFYCTPNLARSETGRNVCFPPETDTALYRISLSSTPFVSRAKSALTPLIAQAMAT
jgi:hypothetical protein